MFTSTVSLLTRVVSLEMSNYVMKMLESVSEVLDTTLEVIPLAWAPPRGRRPRQGDPLPGHRRTLYARNHIYVSPVDMDFSLKWDEVDGLFLLETHSDA